MFGYPESGNGILKNARPKHCLSRNKFNFSIWLPLKITLNISFATLICKAETSNDSEVFCNTDETETITKLI